MADESNEEGPRYDRIGRGYSRSRRDEPRFAAALAKALGGAKSLVNVGAGAGSYEPKDRYVLAIEPSDVMAGQREGRVPAIRANAQALPLRDDAVDAAMTILSLHHWDDGREQGVREMRRVARGPVVIMTYDPRVSGEMWLMADYLPEVAELDHRIFPWPEVIASWLGGDVEIIEVPIPRACNDRMLGAFWAHPEWVFDEGTRNATSGFARQPPHVVERVVAALRSDLDAGVWDARHGYLRALDERDVGLRLVVGR